MLAMATAALALSALCAASAFEALAPETDSIDAAEQTTDAQSGSDTSVSAEWAGPMDWTALDWHPGADLAFNLPPRRLSIPELTDAPATAWSRTENADGSAAVTVKRSLTTGWNSKIGADVTLAPPPTSLSGPINPSAVLPGANTDPSTGAAWATLSTPAEDAPLGLEGTALGARLDTSQTQHKLGVSASKSVTLGEQVSLTLQGGYATTDLSVASAVPVPTSGTNSERVYSTEQVARVAILPTHTTIAAGRTLSSADERWLHTVSAEQKLFEGVTVTGTISESADGTPTTSLVAKFQRRW
jgi:hypothetical protein